MKKLLFFMCFCCSFNFVFSMDQVNFFYAETNKLVDGPFFQPSAFKSGFRGELFGILESKGLDLREISSGTNFEVIQSFITSVYAFCKKNHISWDVLAVSFIYFERSFGELKKSAKPIGVNEIRIVLLGCLILACKVRVDRVDFWVEDFLGILLSDSDCMDDKKRGEALTVLSSAEDDVLNMLQFDVNVSQGDFCKFAHNFLVYAFGREKFDEIVKEILFLKRFCDEVISVLQTVRFYPLKTDMVKDFVKKFHTLNLSGGMKTCDLLILSLLYFQNAFENIIKEGGQFQSIDVLHVLFGSVMIANDKIGLNVRWDEFAKQIFQEESKYMNVSTIKNIISYFLKGFTPHPERVATFTEKMLSAA